MSEWHGAPGLDELLVPVGELEPHPRNPRRGQTRLIAESLARFGQVRPILTDGRQIIAGNHTYAAALELGWTHVAAVKNEFATETEARAYLLADNHLAELGSYGEEQLLELLAGLESYGGWEGTGYQPDDLEDLRALHGSVATTAPEEFQGGYAVDPDELAARAAHLAGGNTVKEVVLVVSGNQARTFDAHIKILSKEYGGGGVSDLVLRAVTSQAGRE